MGQEILIKASGQDTNGNFAIGLLKVAPMSGPPLHLHTREDEWFYILKGEFTFQVGDKRVTAGPGTSVFAPRDVPHTFQNFTEGSIEAVVMVTPAELEHFFIEAASAPLSPEEFGVLFDRYGLVILGPPLAA
jgi:mannose-6-phosphate isomerase-like protein (cupin superfamily)